MALLRNHFVGVLGQLDASSVYIGTMLVLLIFVAPEPTIVLGAW